MLRLLVKKLLQGLIMLLIVSAITFTLLSAAGGDALSGLRDNPQISEKTIEDMGKVYGLDKPLLERYAIWLSATARGDLGESLSFRVPVRTLIQGRFFNTAIISLAAITIAAAIAFLLSILAVRSRNRVLAGVTELLILLSASTPRMVLALAALVITLRFSFVPSATGSPGPAHLLLAALVLAIPLISIFLAQLRNGLIDVMGEDYIRLARAKGLSEWRVLTVHALRAALNPFLTVTGLSLGGLLGGSVIVETVLGWPGIGALMVAAVRARDIPVVMGVVLFASVAVWFGNTLAEFLQGLNDKRLRSGDTTRIY